MKAIKRVCVYCASSSIVNRQYFNAAEKLGSMLARNNIEIVYGGGSSGLMGRLADAALDSGGRVVGVMPYFMNDLEWGHSDLTELILVDDLARRKKRMVQNTDAIIALPGGSGTLEELVEAITWKRLAIYLNPIIICNIDGFYDPFIAMLQRMVDQNFMDARHMDMWTIIEDVAHVIDAIRSAKVWSPDNRQFASIR